MSSLRANYGNTLSFFRLIRLARYFSSHASSGLFDVTLYPTKPLIYFNFPDSWLVCSHDLAGMTSLAHPGLTSATP